MFVLIICSNVNEVIRAVLKEQSPRILRFVSMYVLTNGECEDLCDKLRSLHFNYAQNAHKSTKIKKLRFPCT